MSETENIVTTEDQAPVCAWCLGAIDGEPTVVGPTDRFPDSTAHSWSFHDDCAAEWARCLKRLERLARAGGRHTLLDFPIQNGVEELYGFDEEHQ